MSVIRWSAATTLALCLGMAGVAAQASSPRQANPLKSAIEARNTAIAAAVAKGDTAAVAAVYASNAETVTPNDRVKTRASIEEMWKTMLGRGVASFEATTGDVDLKDGKVTEKGSYVVKTKDGTVVDRGTYENVWTREGDTWKILRNTVTPQRKS